MKTSAGTMIEGLNGNTAQRLGLAHVIFGSPIASSSESTFA